jgi:hypothetical protein
MAVVRGGGGVGCHSVEKRGKDGETGREKRRMTGTNKRGNERSDETKGRTHTTHNRMTDTHKHTTTSSSAQGLSEHPQN